MPIYFNLERFTKYLAPYILYNGYIANINLVVSHDFALALELSVFKQNFW
jgi:hypothetical protein